MTGAPRAEERARLLGKEVVVTLSDGNAEHAAVVARGTLLAWDYGGEVVIRDEMGFVHHCWPMLHITATHIDGDAADGD